MKLTNEEMEERDIAARCSLCEYAVPISGGNTVLCRRKGIMPADGTCRKFRYDLLKRRPAKMPGKLPGTDGSPDGFR